MDVSRGELRKQLLDERDDRIAEFMRQQRPVAVIAELEGLEENYTRKATRRIATERGIDYNPDKEPAPAALLSDASRRFRNNMAKVVYDLRNAPGRHPLEVSRDTGLTQAQQVNATQRAENSNVGYSHDYKLSQLERIAAASGQDFTRMAIIALLDGPNAADKERLKKVLQCLSN